MLLTKEVEVYLCGKLISHYEQLGYEIPRVKTLHGLCVPKNTIIKVKVFDLPKSSAYKVDTRCDGCGRIKAISYSKYNKQVREDGSTYCHKCHQTLFNSGSQHHNWKFDKTDEERVLQRSYDEYRIFTKSVLVRDNYTCQCCGKRGGDMIVHHLYGYAGFPEFRIDQTQAITLCKNCHRAFHNWHKEQYGFAEKGNCTRSDYEKWYKSTIKELPKYNGNLPTARQVYCIEENKIYQSAIEFASAKQIGNSKVYDCCNHKEKVNSVRGYHLIWADEYEKMTSDDLNKYLQQRTNKTLVKVVCVTTGEVFDSMRSASRKYNINSSRICSCCKGNRKFAGKLNNIPLHWMYLSEFNTFLKQNDNYTYMKER